MSDQVMTVKKRKLLVSIAAGALALVMLPGMLPTTARAASSGEIRNQINALKSEKAEILAQMEKVRGQYEANEDEITDLVNQKNVIDQEVVLLNEQIDVIDEEIAAYSLLIADKQDELDEAEVRLADLNAKNKERIRAMEEDGSVSYWSVLFKASSFSDLLDRMNMIEEIAASDQRRLDEISQAAEVVANAREELASEKDALEESRAEQEEAQDVLKDKQNEAEELLKELIAKGEEFEKLLDESEAMQDALMQEIAQAEKDLKQAEYQEWLATYVPPSTKPAATETKPTESADDEDDDKLADADTNQPASSGWVRPLSVWRVTSPFGMRMHPILGYERMHNGIDLGAPEGTPIYAARSGKVTAAAYQANGAGNYVSINHGDGFTSIYMHMTRYVVSPGEYVSAGQVIGYVGNTGLSKGAHLHFGISYNGTYVNPLNYV